MQASAGDTTSMPRLLLIFFLPVCLLLQINMGTLSSEWLASKKLASRQVSLAACVPVINAGIPSRSSSENCQSENVRIESWCDWDFQGFASLCKNWPAAFQIQQG